MQQAEAVRPSSPPLRRAVVSLDRAAFGVACADLLQLAERDGPPDLLIGVPTGGLWVAEAMQAAAGRPLPLLTLTCRRPGTQAKQGSRLFRAVLARLPRPALDGLRLIEHRMVSGRRAPGAAPGFDPGESAALAAWVAAFPGTPRILVVDDAVDSGATLAAVLAEARRVAPGALLRSAAVTVTTAAPLVRPDHALFQRQLCRFPWSMDA